MTNVGRDSSVSIASWYGLDGPEIEYRWRGGGEIFRPGAHPAFYTMSNT
jgi:hypothetical protein